jgi:hypothetical protein
MGMEVCQICGEDWAGALYHEGNHCRNHAVVYGTSKEPYHELVGHCPTCGAVKVPAQWHHLASERQQKKYVALKHVGILLCLNCHGILTERQCTGWDPSWRTEQHPVRCTVQGTYDVLWLWWQRSGMLWWNHQFGELAHVVWTTLLALLQYWGLRTWEVIL